MIYNNKFAINTFILSLFLNFKLVAEPTIGAKLPAVIIDGNDGGLVKGGPWSSAQQLRGKVQIMFYVDPDERDTNEETSQALKAAGFDQDIFGSQAVINMGATWLPNAFINGSLESKQKEYARTVYVKDLNKVLVKQWGIADDASVIILFGKDGEVLFYRAGKLSPAEREQLIALISEKIGLKPANHTKK